MSLNGEGATRGFAEATIVEAKQRLRQTPNTKTRHPPSMYSTIFLGPSGTSYGTFIAAYLSRLNLDLGCPGGDPIT